MEPDNQKPAKTKAAPKNITGIKPHQFQKGKSGNPKGRTPGSLNLRTRIKMWTDTQDEVTLPGGLKTKATIMDAMILGLMAKARKGDAYAFNVLMDRLEGKVADRVVLAGDADSPIIAEQRTDIDYSQLSTAALKEVMAARRKNNA